MGMSQDRVYLTPPENVNILRQKIVKLSQEILRFYLLNGTRGVIAKYICVCIKQGGRQFEQLLLCFISLSYILIVSWHIGRFNK